MPGPRDLLNPPAARQLGLEVDPLESQFAEAQAPAAALTGAPAMMQDQAMSAAPMPTPAKASAQALAPASAMPPDGGGIPLVGEPGSRERKVAFARHALQKFGMKDDDGLWSNHLADLFDAQIQANQMRQHKAETIGALSSFLPSVTRMYAMQRGLQAQAEMMKQYEAEAKGKGIDLTGDEHYLTMKRQAAMGQAKLMQQLNAVDQMYGDLTDKHGIDFGQEGTVSPMAIKMLLTDLKTGKRKPPTKKSSAAPAGAGGIALGEAGPLADAGEGSTPVDTDGDGLPDVLMPDEYLASLR